MARKKVSGAGNGLNIDQFLVAGSDYLVEGAVIAGFYMGTAEWMDGDQKREAFVFKTVPQDGCTLNRGVSYGVFGGGQMRHLLGVVAESLPDVEYPYVIATYHGKKQGDKNKKQLYHTWSIVYDDDVFHDQAFGAAATRSNSKSDVVNHVGYIAKDTQQTSNHYESKEATIEDDEFI